MQYSVFPYLMSLAGVFDINDSRFIDFCKVSEFKGHRVWIWKRNGVSIRSSRFGNFVAVGKSMDHITSELKNLPVISFKPILIHILVRFPIRLDLMKTVEKMAMAQYQGTLPFEFSPSMFGIIIRSKKIKNAIFLYKNSAKILLSRGNLQEIIDFLMEVIKYFGVPYKQERLRVDNSEIIT